MSGNGSEAATIAGSIGDRLTESGSGRVDLIVNGSYWGPGGFRSALREAVEEGVVKRLRGGEYAPAHSAGEPGASQPTEC